MSDEFDKHREEAMTEIREAYSETVADHATNPRNVEIMPGADGYGCALGNCGDCIEIWLRVKNEHIAEATFWTDGCGATVASGSMVTELPRGKTAVKAMRINQSDVLAALDGLPSENEHLHARGLASNVRGGTDGLQEFR